MRTDPWRSQIRSKVSGVKVFSVSRRIISDATVIFPPIYEQKEICAYLDTKCAELDNLISAKLHLLDELASYKKSVIYETVTGKREVPACL